MRRISLALALIGAVGCGQTSTSNTGGNRGVTDNTFSVTVQNGQNGNTSLAIKGGYVTSNPAGIDCGEGTHTLCTASFTARDANGNPLSVTLTATSTTVPFFGFAGDCKGTAPCTLLGDNNADRYVLAQFGNTAGGHPDWSNPYMHVANFLSGAFDCQSCHGPTLAGAGLAPSCSKCHSWPYGVASITDTFAGITDPFAGSNSAADVNAWDNVIGGHFVATGHNSGACGRCHSGFGFKDYIGADGTADNHELGYTVAIGVTKAAALDNTALTNGFDCTTCHNAKTYLGGGSLNTIAFPSFSASGGKTVVADLAGPSSIGICGQCHTTVRDDRNLANVYKQLVATGATTTLNQDVQLVTADNKAVRPHYLGAAASLLGADAAVYIQYSGAIYNGRNEHGGVGQCAYCHEAHNGSLPVDRGPVARPNDITAKCGGCHFDEVSGLPVTTFLQLEDGRQFGFEGDIDGDGNTTEPLNAEIAGLEAKLLAAMQNYATNVAGTSLCMAVDSAGLVDQPYIDVNANGTCDTGEATAYNKFTARLLKASFNYSALVNDPGVWAHNPRYAIEILYDTIADLNSGLQAAGKTAFASNGIRSFNGHFGGASKGYATMIYHGGSNAAGDVTPPMGFTSAACYQCHGGKAGMAVYLAAPTAPAWPASPFTAIKTDNIQCSTCHALDGTDMKGLRTDVTSLNLPGQKATAGTYVTITNLPATIAVCGTCHSGRENGASITTKIGAKLDGDFSIGSTNPHYLGAAAMIMGGDGAMLYQYAGQTYAGKAFFWNAANNGAAPGPHGSPHGAECSGCHQPKASKHTFEVDLAYCGTCHVGQYALAPVEEEVLAAEAELLTAIQAYVTTNAAAAKTGNCKVYSTGGDCVTPLAATSSCNDACQALKLADANALTGACYDNARNAYWFIQTASGCSTTGFNFDPKSAKAAFNYTWSQKEPGVWAHNEPYIMQAMFDSITDLGGAAPTFTRP